MSAKRDAPEGKKVPEAGGRFEESLTVDEQIARMVGNLSAFLAKLSA